MCFFKEYKSLQFIQRIFKKKLALKQQSKAQKQSMSQVIKFKSTNTSHQILQLAFNQEKTIYEYKQQIAQQLNDQAYNIKLVHKGKVLGDKQKVGLLGLKNSTVMMVLTKTKKQQKVLTSAEQVIPRSGLNTGLGGSSPVGFGGYGIVNHPQYMSAISSAVDQEKIEEIMDDPYYQSMMEQMLDDPDTLRQLMEENPMTKQLMKDNPMMKHMMTNPAMMKMLLNKDTIKMTKEMQKNGGLSNASNMSALGGLGGLEAFNGNTANNQTNPMMNPMMNPFMMGSGFGGNPAQNFPNQNIPSSFSNPFLMSQGMFGMNQNNQNSQNNQNNLNPMSNFTSMFSNLSFSQQNTLDEQKYQSQIKQLSSMGFNDKEKCIKYLKQTEGDVDRTIQKLCQQDDLKQNPKK